MVLIDAYQQIINHHSYVLFGRKGSGKSTLQEIIENYDPEEFSNQYQTLYPIKFDKMELESLYSLYSYISKETNNLFRTSDIIQVFWELFFIIAAIVTVIRDYEKKQNNRFRAKKAHCADSFQGYRIIFG